MIDFLISYARQPPYPTISPTWHWARGMVHPGKVSSSSQNWYRDKQPHNLTFIPTRDLELLINLMCLSGSQSTHTDTRRTCKTQKGLGWKGTQETSWSEATTMPLPPTQHNGQKSITALDNPQGVKKKKKKVFMVSTYAKKMIRVTLQVWIWQKGML